MHWRNNQIMKKTGITLIVSLLILIGHLTAASAFDQAVLDRLIVMAQQKNPLIGASHERVISSEAAIEEASAKMGPKIGVAAGALWQKDDPLLPAISPVTGSLIGVVPVGYRNTYVAAAGFIQTVYAGGSLYAGKQAAMLAKEAVVADEKRVGQSVSNAVRIAFYNLKRAEEKEVVAKESVGLAKSHLTRAEKLFKAGVVAKSDVLRSKVAVADAELGLIRVANSVKIALTSLERAVGTEISPDSVKTGAPLSAKDILNAMETDLPDDHMEMAYKDRMELKVYDNLSRQAYKIARAERGQLLPQIVAGGAITNVDNGFFPSGNEEWLMGMMVYWNLFDSGEISAKTKQAKAKARELLCMLDDAKNSIKMEVTQAELNLKSAESRLNVAERQVTESEEDYRIAVKRYEEQVGTNLDILDARLALINSKTERVDALYDISIAYANLIYAVGK